MSRYRWITYIILLLAVLLLIETVPFIRNWVSPLTVVTQPVERALYDGVRGTRLALERLILGREASEELDRLRAEVTQLGAERAHLKTLEEENAQLKRLAGFAEHAALSLVTVPIIGLDPRQPDTLIRLGAGEIDGIVVGAAVVDPAGVLVGTVTNVSRDTSVVRLLMHRDTKLPVRIAGKTQVFGLLENPGGLLLQLNQVPKRESVAPGDVVVTDIGAGVPPGLAIGVVMAVSTEEAALWQTATVAPLVELRTIRVVGVVISS